MAALCVAHVLARGWIERMVQCHAGPGYLRELQKPLQIHASIEHAPTGYEDSVEWELSTVWRLVSLLDSSESTASVRAALLRVLNPNRVMNDQGYYRSTYKDFNSNEEFVDVDTGKEEVPDHNAVIVVRNSLEARLPSGTISIRLLRDIFKAGVKGLWKAPVTLPRATPGLKPVNMSETTTMLAESTVMTPVTGTSSEAIVRGSKEETTTEAGAGESTDHFQYYTAYY